MRDLQKITHGEFNESGFRELLYYIVSNIYICSLDITRIIIIEFGCCNPIRL